MAEMEFDIMDRPMSGLSVEREEIHRKLKEGLSYPNLIQLQGRDIPNGNRIFTLDYTQNRPFNNFIFVEQQLFYQEEKAVKIVPGVTPLIEQTTGPAGAALGFCAENLGFIKAQGGFLNLSIDEFMVNYLKRMNRWGIALPEGYDFRKDLLVDSTTGENFPLDSETKDLIESGNLPLDRLTIITHGDVPRARVEHIRDYNVRVLFGPSGGYGPGNIHLMRILLVLDMRDNAQLPAEQRLFSMTKVLPGAELGYYPVVDRMYEQYQCNFMSEGRKLVLCNLVGSGDYITGVGGRLKELNPEAGIVAIEDAMTRPLSYLKDGQISPEAGMSGDALWGSTATGVGGENFNIDFSIIDRIEGINREGWISGQEKLARQEYFVGRSSGAEYEVAMRLAEAEKNTDFWIAFHDPAWNYTDHFPFARVKA